MEFVFKGSKRPGIFPEIAGKQRAFFPLQQPIWLLGRQLGVCGNLGVSTAAAQGGSPGCFSSVAVSSCWPILPWCPERKGAEFSGLWRAAVDVFFSKSLERGNDFEMVLLLIV